MKATKIFQVLSLALIIAAVLDANSSQAAVATIRHEVTIHLTFSVNTCNTYYVRITDENGRLVAPPQIYVPGVNKYVFNELVSLPGRARIASLVLPSNVDPYVCPNNLTTKSDRKFGPFLFGKTYTYDLYPLIQKGVIKED
jgi:hypothetical protein